ncbi:helix-turn-helix domain-containing protein [Microbacterium invictum]|uniref:DNA-binding transcriptional ArsR family regulator n=1 Tax=Microbacterium invictum TaxID=515415 RepID=A0AA40SMT4_9MICO|nr:helix-turn-helix domain-containing protein [Microbacterium invictum]MBB4139029.1 DNA-binding transcriptional ArsR family regulator [Microbacterium invictum]
MDANETENRPPQTREMRVLDTGALKALAHPVRVEIYDILSSFGAQTASSLAARLGESSGVTSYHLRALAKHDLIREVPDRGTGRERWWERPPGGVSFTNPDAMSTPAGKAASQVVMSEYYERRHRQLRDFLATALDNETEEWQDATMLSTATARLTATQLHELSEKIMELVDEVVDNYRDQQGEGVRPVSIRTDLFPLDEGRSS